MASAYVAPVSAVSSPYLPESAITAPTRPVGCSSWSEPFACPLTLYTILVIFNVVAMLVGLASSWRTNGFNSTFTNQIFAFLLYLVVTIILGVWLNNLCKRCENGTAWGVFILLFLLQLVIFGGVLVWDRVLSVFTSRS